MMFALYPFRLESPGVVVGSLLSVLLCFGFVSSLSWQGNLKETILISLFLQEIQWESFAFPEDVSPPETPPSLSYFQQKTH